jgi:hypothetical protein
VPRATHGQAERSVSFLAGRRSDVLMLDFRLRSVAGPGGARASSIQIKRHSPHGEEPNCIDRDLQRQTGAVGAKQQASEQRGDTTGREHFERVSSAQVERPTNDANKVTP